jgi:hypothetical protein
MASRDDNQIPKMAYITNITKYIYQINYFKQQLICIQNSHKAYEDYL